MADINDVNNVFKNILCVHFSNIFPMFYIVAGIPFTKPRFNDVCFPCVILKE